jgi:AcrR family transcriptional regulator
MRLPSPQTHDQGTTASPLGSLAATANSPRKRRSRREIDHLIIDAALALFASKGFSGTTMREIAERAGVYEPMVYRRFRSKDELFQAAVLLPFNQLVTTFICDRHVSDAADPGLSHTPLDELYDLFTECRELSVALAAGCRTSDHDEDLGATITGHEIERLVEALVPLTEARRYVDGVDDGHDPTAVVAVTMGLALGVALLEPFFTSPGRGLSRDQLREEMRRFCFAPDRPGADDRSDRTSGPSEVAGQLLRQIAGTRRRAGKAESELRELKLRTRSEAGA